jgi:uncharacterized membrane protein YbhN (UPF0104 family)
MWDGVADVAPAWLVLGVLLHLGNQVARGCGWRAVVRAAGPEPRRRDAVAAWVAGAGAGGLVSARGGDAVRVWVLARRVPGVPWPVLAGTLVAEAAGELLLGLALVAVALTAGVGPELGVPGPLAAATATLVLGAVLVARRMPRARAFAARVAAGCTLLRSPRRYLGRVLPWQLASRLLRLAALACFLAGFGVPATPVAVLLVVFAQTSGRLVPFGPAAVGAGVAMLAATFEPVTGTAVPAARLAAFFVGTSTLLTVVGTVLSLAICVQASAKAGHSVPTLRGLRAVARAATVPRP